MSTKANKRTPLLWACGWGREVLPLAGRLLVITLAVIVMGLMFSALQAIKTDVLRVAVSAVVALGMALLYLTEGLNRGGRDAFYSRQVMRLTQAGKPVEAVERARCFHPLKAGAACLLVFALPLALGVYLAVTAKPYTYALQDLPQWLTYSYGNRQDVMAPLATYLQPVGTTAVDWVRVFVRVFVMPFVNFFSDPQRMSATIDRVTPLCLLCYPLAFMAGYLCGPKAQARLEARQKRAKKAAVRKQKKHSLTAELLGESNVPHYGHAREEDKPKKKELV